MYNRMYMINKMFSSEFISRSIRYIMSTIFGSFAIGIGLYNFAKVNSFPLPGINGIALLINHFFGIQIGIFSLLINIPIIIICYKFLSRKFVIKSIGTLLSTAFMVDVVCPLFPQFTHDTMLAAICTGLFLGIGNSIIFSNNTSGGGFDFVTMAIKSKKPYFSIGTLTFIISAIIITASSIAYRDITGLIYGVIIIFINATVTDQVLNKLNSGKLLLIITGKYHEIGEDICYEINRSATLITGKGIYTNNDSHVILCACSDRQMYEIKKIVAKYDKKAFTIVLNSKEVVGKGFIKQGSI